MQRHAGLLDLLDEARHVPQGGIVGHSAARDSSIPATITAANPATGKISTSCVMIGDTTAGDCGLESCKAAGMKVGVDSHASRPDDERVCARALSVAPRWACVRARRATPSSQVHHHEFPD
jgi:hypothetical protein